MGSRALGAADESGARPAAPVARGSDGLLRPAPPMASALEDPVLIRPFRGHRAAVTGVAFNADTAELATCSLDRFLMVWNLKTYSTAYRLAGHTEALTSVEFSPSEQVLASASQDHTIRLWAPCIYGESSVLKGHTASVRSVSFSQDGYSVVSASNDKSIKIWSVCYQRLLFTLFGHTRWVRCAKFSPDGRIIASCGEDKSVNIWDARNKICINTFSDCEGFENFVAFNPSGTCVASAGSNHTVKLWDIRMNKLLQHLKVHRAGVNCLSFHPSGNYLITASTDGTLKILDLLGERLIYTLHGHKGPVLCVAFSKGGEKFASGGTDAQVLLWKTNFDSLDYAEVLKHNFRRTHVHDRPHLLDMFSRSSHLCDENLQSIEVNPALDLPDTQTPDPVVIEIRTSSPISTRGVGQPEEQCSQCSSASPLAMSSKRKAENENGPAERIVHRHRGITCSVDNALDHIVGQLDTLTLTIAILEQRLACTEDKLNECIKDQQKVLLKGKQKK
ncbi:LOW QUALITY PROTEIN: POC1 centriolar protein homolog B [Malurus melanocephalus]|uniref:LOW QUALITY PROTEIN: POC1 centriolar protein homolog B n=1 Tax=Malurus melanocephalus TaxID=175006 RepID=UPI002546B03C|nr:LOW QUALITY PROTEIN: POC1 centriolar protein homolog B [Malurus melanocephalus]